jgi:hypothetical protein
MISMKNRCVTAIFIAWFCVLEACEVMRFLSCVRNIRLRQCAPRLLVSVLVVVHVLVLMPGLVILNSDCCWLDTDYLLIQWLEIFQLQCILPSMSLWHVSVPSHRNSGLWCIALFGLGLMNPSTLIKTRMSEYEHVPHHDYSGRTFIISSPSITV